MANGARFVVALRNHLILQALETGHDVVIDDTNLRSANFTEVCNLIRESGFEATVTERCFHVELTEALARDAARAQPVGPEAIRNTWDRYYATLRSMTPRTEVIVQNGKSQDPAQFVPGLPSAVVCDMDGTLAIMGNRSPYDASECDKLDSPNVPVCRCLDAMLASGSTVLFVSAREEKDRAPTERFIRACGFSPDRLYMRATGDTRKDAVVKRELFDTHIRGRFNVLFVLDDRNQVVRAWRSMGLPCFQVAEGAF